MIPCTSTRLSSRVRISRSFPMLPAGIPCPAPQNRNKVFSGSAKIVRRGYSPPGTGGVAAPLRKRREATEAAQTGWSDRRAYVFAELTTPAAPSKEASRHFLDGASTPPVPGGEHPQFRLCGASDRTQSCSSVVIVSVLVSHVE